MISLKFISKLQQGGTVAVEIHHSNLALKYKIQSNVKNSLSVNFTIIYKKSIIYSDWSWSISYPVFFNIRKAGYANKILQGEIFESKQHKVNFA
jgi:hypothetical protein